MDDIAYTISSTVLRAFCCASCERYRFHYLWLSKNVTVKLKFISIELANNQSTQSIKRDFTLADFGAFLLNLSTSLSALQVPFEWSEQVAVAGCLFICLIHKIRLNGWCKMSPELLSYSRMGRNKNAEDFEYSPSRNCRISLGPGDFTIEIQCNVALWLVWRPV